MPLADRFRAVDERGAAYDRSWGQVHLAIWRSSKLLEGDGFAGATPSRWRSRSQLGETQDADESANGGRDARSEEDPSEEDRTEEGTS
jgi:hypothetical protein